MQGKPLYPDQARFVARVCGQLGLRFTDLDNGNGYLFQVSNGQAQFISGDGRICAYPLNAASANDVSRDKAHTAAILANTGLPTIPGTLYFITDYHARLRPLGRELPDAIRAVADAAGPVFCKPNTGSHGDLAEVVADAPAFLDYVERARRRYDAILLQPIVDGDEYRVFCLDGEAIFSLQRENFALVGDGVSDLRALLARENARLDGAGVSPRDVEANRGGAVRGRDGRRDGHRSDDEPARRDIARGALGWELVEIEVLLAARRFISTAAHPHSGLRLIGLESVRDLEELGASSEIAVAVIAQLIVQLARLAEVARHAVTALVCECLVERSRSRSLWHRVARTSDDKNQSTRPNYHHQYAQQDSNLLPSE